MRRGAPHARRDLGEAAAASAAGARGTPQNRGATSEGRVRPGGRVRRGASRRLVLLASLLSARSTAANLCWGRQVVWDASGTEMMNDCTVAEWLCDKGCGTFVQGGALGDGEATSAEEERGERVRLLDHVATLLAGGGRKAAGPRCYHLVNLWKPHVGTEF